MGFTGVFRGVVVYKVVDGTHVKWCWGCQCYLRVDRFSVSRPGSKREGQRLSRCKPCQTRKKTLHTSESGYVYVSKVWHLYDEVVQRLGVEEAAARMEVSSNSLRDILYKRRTKIQRRRVAAMLLLLKSLREQNVWAAPTVGRPRHHTDGIKCKGCGTDVDNYTEGCKSCSDRRLHRQRRGLTNEASAVQ